MSASPGLGPAAPWLVWLAGVLGAELRETLRLKS